MRAVSEVSKLVKTTRQTSRAAVSLCFAQTLNGGMAGTISGRESMEMTHFLRSQHEGILVGINTILSDNSRLTCRLIDGADPIPVVLDSNLRIPLESHIANRPGSIIFKREGVLSEKEEILMERGIQVISSPQNKHGLDLGFVTGVLKEKRLENVMVEGGGQVLQSFVEQELIDNCFITVGASYQEGDVRVRNMNLRLPKARTFQLGDDAFVVWSRQYENQEKFVEARMPTEFGDLMMRKYRTGEICMYHGSLSSFEYVPLRIHSSCMTSEVFGSTRCDCSWQLKEALRIIRESGGIVIYLNQEGRGIGLSDKLRAYRMQDQGMDTVEANLALGHQNDYRNFESCVNILKEDFNVQNVCLLSNNPDKIRWARNNFENVTHSRIVPPKHVQSEGMKEYLKTKKEKLNHILPNGGKNGWVREKGNGKLNLFERQPKPQLANAI